MAPLIYGIYACSQKKHASRGKMPFLCDFSIFVKRHPKKRKKEGKSKNCLVLLTTLSWDWVGSVLNSAQWNG